MKNELRLNRCQQRMLAFDDSLPVLCDFGGRGAGRTTGALLIAFRYLQTYERARWLYCRQIEKGVRQAYEEAQNLAHLMGLRLTPNGTQLTLTLSNKSVLEFGVLEDQAYFDARYRGQSQCGIVLDEMATWPDLALPLRMFTTLRHASYPTRAILLSNPGVSGPLLKKRLINPSTFGIPFQSDFLGGKTTVVLTSSYRDNEFLPDDYVMNLRAASMSEASFKRDALGQFDATEHALHEITAAHFVHWDAIPRTTDWSFRIGFDAGSVAPWSAIWLAKALRDTQHEGEPFAEDTLVAFWETTSATPESGFTKTNRAWSAEETAQALREDAADLGIRLPVVYADLAVGARIGTETVLQAFHRCGINMVQAEKPSIKDGTLLINNLLRGAAPAVHSTTMPIFAGVTQRVRPGLFLRDGAVPALTSCLETCISDARDPDKLPTSFPLKHHRDGLVYGVVGSSKGAKTTTESAWWAGGGPSMYGDAYYAVPQTEQEARRRIRERTESRGTGRGWNAGKVSR